MILQGYFDVSLVVITIAYFMTWHGDYWAGSFALFMGLLMDVLSAAPLGLFSVIYVLVFLGVKAGDALFDLQAFKGQTIVVFLAVLLKKFLFLGFLQLLDLEFTLGAAIIFGMICSAFFTAVAAPAVFFFYDALDRMVSRVDIRKERGSP